MGGINGGIGGNEDERDEEREDLRIDTKDPEADTAGLALEEIGVNASLNPDDPSDPANFVSAELDSQGQKDFTDGVEERHHGAGDRHGTILTHNMRGHGDDQHGGHISGTQAGEIQKRRLELMEQREESRARRLSTLIALGSIADIQTYEQFEEYHRQMGVELDQMEQKAAQIEIELSEVRQEYDGRIQAMEEALAFDKERLAGMTPGTEEYRRLEMHISATETTLNAFKDEHAQLTSEWDEYAEDFAEARARHDALQQRYDAAVANGSSQADLEALKVELQQAQDAMTAAQTSLNQVDSRIDFANQSLDQMAAMTQVFTENGAERFFSEEELMAQQQLAITFTRARADGRLSPDELSEIQALYVAGGITEDKLSELENMTGENAEMAKTLATSLREAQEQSMAGLAASGIGMQAFDDQGNAIKDEDGNNVYVYGDDMTAQMNAMMTQLSKDVETETQNVASVEYHVVNPITDELNDRIDALRESREAQTLGLSVLEGTEEVQATDALIELYENRRDQIAEDFEKYTTQMEDARQRLEQLRADPDNVNEQELREAEKALEEAQQARVDLQLRGQALEHTLEATQSLTSDLEANAERCGIDGTGARQMAEVAMAATLIDRTDLSLEQRMEAIQAAGSKAFIEATSQAYSSLGVIGDTTDLDLTDNDINIETIELDEVVLTPDGSIFEFNFSDFNLTIPTATLASLTIPSIEVIGSGIAYAATSVADTAINLGRSAMDSISQFVSGDDTDDTTWNSDEQLVLGTSEADIEASRRVQAMIEGGQITESNLDQALETLDVDRETVERRLAEQGVEILKPENGVTDVSSSIFVDQPDFEETTPQMASYRSLAPAGPGSIQVPYSPIAAPSVKPEPIGPLNYASFADTELDNYGPPLAGADTPVNNRAPDSGTAPSAFASANNAASVPSSAQPGAAQPASPSSGAPDTSAADAIAQRNEELRLAEEQARLAQNTGNPGAPAGGGGSSIA